jgi:hypothetical protein
VRSGDTEAPGCCDIPAVTTYTISDQRASLSCTMQSGGFAAIDQVQCSYLVEDVLQCMAMPVCDEGDTQVDDQSSCLQDIGCYKVSMCGQTIWCSDTK